MVPEHLKPFVVEQHYEEYTPVDQAVWRYVMRQNYTFLGERAHEAYTEGLAATGIGVERIPDIEYMNQCLSKFGWKAVTIDGFIPPEAFMDFQAHGILAISADIRTDEHVAYTPAPDIIHESAGHAPMIFNDQYRQYLQMIGELGAKALASREDHELYEAIRKLSILKEDPSSSPEEIAEAEEDLNRKMARETEPSEATLISRLYWWTVEYGLIGDLDRPKIYGAGLLSSVGESQSCLLPEVKKIPFSLDCIHYDYDITKKQPQLFVCRDFEQLIEVAEEFARTMALNVGGTESLEKGLRSANTATYVYSSGLQVSGTISELLYDDQNEAIYVRTQGPSALAYQNQELPGHGKDYHHHGFGSPVGKVVGLDKPLEMLSIHELESYGIAVGKRAELTFASGLIVNGIVKEIVQRDGKNLIISFKDCTVTYKDQTLFYPDWGIYDMAVGERITSVFAGAADKARFQTGTTKPSGLKTKRRQYDEVQKKRHTLYQEVRELRERGESVPAEHLLQQLHKIYALLKEEFPHDWLVRLEILELLVKREIGPDLQDAVRADLSTIMNMDSELYTLIENGLKIIMK
jgi:phenylalanine-4-hydroxylase